MENPVLAQCQQHTDQCGGGICDKLGSIGVKLDEEANAAHAPIISTPDSRVTVHVIPTDEELGIARRTCEVI